MTDAARGQHLRPRLPGLRRAAPRPAAVASGLLRQTLRGGLRDRPRRAGPRSRRSCCSASRCCRRCSRSGITALAAQAGARRALEERLADPPRHLPGPDLDAGHAVLRRPGARAVRARPALRRAAAVLLAGPDPLDYALARTGGLFLAVFLIVARAPARPDRRRASWRPPTRSTGLRDERRTSRATCSCRVLSSALLAGVAAVIAAWTPRRAYATAAIIAVFIVPPIIVGAHRRAGGRRPRPAPRAGQPGRRRRRPQRRRLRHDPGQPGRRRRGPAGLGVSSRRAGRHRGLAGPRAAPLPAVQHRDRATRRRRSAARRPRSRAPPTPPPRPRRRRAIAARPRLALVRQRRRGQRHLVRPGAGRHRPARAQRRRQVDAPAPARRPARAVGRERSGSPAGRRSATRGLSRRSGSCPSARPCPAT